VLHSEKTETGKKDTLCIWGIHLDELDPSCLTQENWDYIVKSFGQEKVAEILGKDSKLNELLAMGLIRIGGINNNIFYGKALHKNEVNLGQIWGREAVESYLGTHPGPAYW